MASDYDDDDDASSSHRSRWPFRWPYGIADAMPGSSDDSTDQELSFEPLVDPIGWVFGAYEAGGRHGYFL